MQLIKKTIYILSAVAVLAGCRSAAAVANGGKKDKSIVILYENDVHCGIDGYAKLAGLRDAIRDTADVAVVSCGDFLQGDIVGAISHGQYIIDIMKTVGYDAVTLGNHEFDYYVPRLRELLDDLGAPVTCVNFTDADHNRIYLPYVMKKLSGKTVAFIGVVTPITMVAEEFAFYDKDGRMLYDLCPTEVFRQVQEQVDAVRSMGADYVVILSHLGERPITMNVDSHLLVGNTTGIDVVLDGHTHTTIPSETVMSRDGKPVLITQAGTKFKDIGKLLIQQGGRMSTTLLHADEVPFENIHVKHTTDSIKALCDEVTRQPVCQCPFALRILDDDGNEAVRMGETNAGDLLMDAFREMNGTDIGIMNAGSIRCELPYTTGTLTLGNIIAMLPYDNNVVTIHATGEQILEVLTKATRFLPKPYADFPQVSGLKFTANTGTGVSDVMVLDKQTGEYLPIDSQRTYSVATTDYCVTGGGLQSVFKQCTISKGKTLTYRDILIKYITERHHSVVPEQYRNPQGRITVK